MNNEHPKIFISYAWEDEEHKQWVKRFANQLIADGIDAVIDQYDLTLGDRLPHFMEQFISEANYVIIICTPTYKKKSDSRVGGVGYEGHIISGELLSKGNESKFIPVIRKGTVQSALPVCLAGKLAVDLSKEQYYDVNYQDLVTTVYGVKYNKPILGNRPQYVQKMERNEKIVIHQSEDVHILGIITDRVTVPKMDGTRGSALYKIPFKLSKSPSSLWRELFINAWKNPPSFTTMHRFGIASVYGDEIILDGTTIEEVRDYHRDTLLLCVQEANKREKEILEQQRRRVEVEKRKKEQHYSNINNIAEEIKF